MAEEETNVDVESEDDEETLEEASEWARLESLIEMASEKAVAKWHSQQSKMTEKTPAKKSRTPSGSTSQTAEKKSTETTKRTNPKLTLLERILLGKEN